MALNTDRYYTKDQLVRRFPCLKIDDEVLKKSEICKIKMRYTLENIGIVIGIALTYLVLNLLVLFFVVDRIGISMDEWEEEEDDPYWLGAIYYPKDFFLKRENEMFEAIRGVELYAKEGSLKKHLIEKKIIKQCDRIPKKLDLRKIICPTEEQMNDEASQHVVSRFYESLDKVYPKLAHITKMIRSLRDHKVACEGDIEFVWYPESDRKLLKYVLRRIVG